jgi:hypothetical protein
MKPKTIARVLGFVFFALIAALTIAAKEDK